MILLRRTLLYALAVFVVTAAVTLSVARILLPEVQGYKENIEQQLGELLEQNVRIREVDARLIGLTPTIVFKGVQLIDDSGVKELISFNEAHLGIAVIQSLLQHTLVPSNFTIVGTTISLLQMPDGGYSVQGFDISALGTFNALDSKISEELANWLLEQSSIGIKDSVVIWKKKNDTAWHRFEKVNVVLHNRAERHQLTGSFELPEGMGQNSRIAMDVSGDLLQPEKWQGLIYIKSTGIQFSKLGISPEFNNLNVKDGIADFELWGEWADAGFEQISGDIAVYGLEIENIKSHKTARIDKLQGKFDWQGKTSDWTLRVDQLTLETQGSTWKDTQLVVRRKQIDKNNSQLDLGLSYAKIDDVRSLLLKSGLYTGVGAEMLAGLRPTGELRDLDIHYSQSDKAKDRYKLNARIERFGVTAWQQVPGIFGVNALINLNESSGHLTIDGKNAIVTRPDLFRQSIIFNTLSADLNLYNSGTGWVLQSNDIAVKNKDFDLSVGLMLMLPNDKNPPYVDLQLAFKDVDASAVHRYQPARIMKEKLVTWMDDSFKSGRADEANIVYRGWLSDFPFNTHAGVMNGYFVAHNVSMNYFPGWPGMDKLAGEAEFTARGLSVRVDTARIHNGDIKNLAVRIDDFTRPILFIEGDAYSTTHDGFHFFSKTPLGKRSLRFVSKTRFEGDIHSHMTFSVALDKDLAKKYKRRFSAYVETDNSAMYLLHKRLDVTDIKGRVYFSSKKHHGEGITAKLLEGNTKIRVSSRIVGVKPVMEIMGEGTFDPVMLDRRFKKLGLMRISGQVPWKGKLTLGHKNAQGEGRQPARMWIKTDFVGTTIDLPEPFRKSAETSRKTLMKFTFLPSIKTVFSIQYSDRMSVAMRMNNLFFPARIEIGEMKFSSGKAHLPEKDEFRLSGVINNMDQYGWREVMQQHYNKYHKLRTRPIVEVPVIIDFAYVNVPFDKARAKPRKRYTSPKIMPAFKGQIRRFVFAGKEFGKLEFDSRRDKFGLAFDKIRMTSPHMEFNAKLNWHYIGNWHKTKMKGSLKTSNLGNLMTSVGLSGKFADGDGEVKLDLNWANPFYVFRAGHTNGQLDIALEDGVVTAINPGAGRFLGLLNLSTLPRRLLLDFKDVGSGYAFDSMTGIINLKKGIASSKGMVVDSTIADVLAVGRVDIRNKQFDQIVTVTPQVAGTMPVIGGLLIGTGVIPLVWLFERMFGSDMDKSISRQYHISGPWKKPTVERIDKEDEPESIDNDDF